MTAEPDTGVIAPGASAADPAAAPLAPVAPSSRLPGWAAWAIGAGLIVLAWFVALVTPGEEQAQAPFVVTAEIGEPAAGRNLTATITDISRAADVSAVDGWTAEGNWLVVDLHAASVTSEGGAIKHAIVEIDGVRFGASDRPDSLLDTTMTAGVPQVGSLAFELPRDLTAGAGRIELALDVDVRLDSMIVLSFDLADVPVLDEVELVETGWANS